MSYRVKLLAVVGLAAASVVTLPGQAQAHDACPAWHGRDYACVNQFHTRFHACDHEVDGHKVRAWWKSLAGSTGVGRWDPDGAGGACSDDPLPGQAVWIRICEEVAGCSAWYRK
jgi:hypothetical protein